MKDKKTNKKEEEVVLDYDDIDEDGAEVTDKVKKLKAKLQACNKERQEYLSLCQRARADLINERKELEKNTTRIAGNAREGLILELLAVLDSFDMAFANKGAWEQVDANWRTGVEHIHTHFLSILAQYGFTPFDPLQEPFNPEEHESLGTVLVDDKKEADTIVEVLQKGYRQGEEILRPAKVKIGVYKV